MGLVAPWPFFYHGILASKPHPKSVDMMGSGPFCCESGENSVCADAHKDS